MKKPFAPHNMEYVTAHVHLIMPEYGRNVQQLVAHAKTIVKDEERQAFVEEIIEIVLKLNPHIRTTDDYLAKLWKHILYIGNFELKVTPPKGIVVPQTQPGGIRHDRLEYPSTNKKMRHYGAHIQKLIAKAVETEEGPIRDGMVDCIGSFMKLAYKQWNREHMVNEGVVRDDLLTLSGGMLDFNEDNFDYQDIPQALRRRSQAVGMPGMTASPHQHTPRKLLVISGKERIIRSRKTRK